MYILVPEKGGAAYLNAAQIFADMYFKICGKKAEIGYIPRENEDMVVIGTDEVQPFVFGKIPGGMNVKCNGDDYCIISKEENGRNLLFLAGGRGRSTIYAVYDFFERKCGCHYFWDGDVITKSKDVDITGLDVFESPRFTYRAIRYFAHRGLDRYQAEHWDFDEWKKEIDWICKSRLNTFMLRIGIDDLFQKAFPDIVDYPSNEEVLPEALTGYNDRTTFWDLRYRGELRKRVLDYAFSMDLIHPEDSGTMTHWYSRTPLQFLDAVKPGFLSQTSKSQSEQTGLVWDIFDEKNLENYQKLTDTHVKEYGKSDIFHTIGLAERTYNEDRQKNLELKKYAYRKIIGHIEKNYPNAKMLIAAWDFYFALKPEEVREITKMFDPEKTIIFDYTVDLKSENNNFEKWDIIGKIPWIFGIFHGYEPQNHIHGDYEYISEKLKIADADPFCKGMAFWPELSHSDTLMLEYFRENAWRPSGRSIEEIAEEMCVKRYGEDAEIMNSLWQYFIKTMKLPLRSSSGIPVFCDVLRTECPLQHMLREGHEYQKHHMDIWKEHLDDNDNILTEINSIFDIIESLPADVYEKEFIHRDVCDMLKTIVIKKLHYAIMGAAYLLLAWKHGEVGEGAVRERLSYSEKLLGIFADVLALHKDASLFESYKNLGKNRKVNPYFENALKENVINWYCRTNIYEAVKYVYIPEMKVFADWVTRQLDRNDKGEQDVSYFDEEKARIFSEFKKMPLADMYEGVNSDYIGVVRKLREMF